MPEHNRLAREVEKDLLAADVQFFFDFAMNPRLAPIKGQAVLSLMPFLSSFALDSFEYLKSRKIVGTEFLKAHEGLLLTSRLRMKPLEVNKKSFDEVLEEIDYLVGMGEQWFVGEYPWPLRVLRKVRQPDAGLQFIGEEIFCTTHVTTLNLGVNQEMIEEHALDFDDLGEFMSAASTDIGLYMKSLASVLDMPPNTEAWHTETGLPILRYKDYSSPKLYQQLTNTVAERPAVCVLLTAILSQVNFALLLLPYIAVGNEFAAFKIRFLSLYHAASTLDKLMGVQKSQRKVLKDMAEKQIKHGRSSPAVRTVSDYHLLRNALIHYDVQPKKVNSLSADKHLYGFVEAHAKGRGWEEVNDLVVEGLDHLSQSLGALLPEDATPKHDLG